MNRPRTIMWLLGSMFLAACATDTGVAPYAGPGRGVGLTPSFTTYAASGSPSDSLHVVINGRQAVAVAGNQRYTASVSNTTATQFHYVWFRSDCLSNCATTPMYWFAESDTNSIYVGFARTSDEVILTVHVVELNGTGRGGADRFIADGPDFGYQGLTGDVANQCDMYNDLFYPLYGKKPGTNMYYHFRHNYCNNQDTWDPTDNGTPGP